MAVHDIEENRPDFKPFPDIDSILFTPTHMATTTTPGVDTPEANTPDPDVPTPLAVSKPKRPKGSRS